MYDVIIQFASSIVDPKYPEICGIATLVADVARQANDVGRRIESATSHKGAGVCLYTTFGILLNLYLRNNRHTRNYIVF